MQSGLKGIFGVAAVGIFFAAASLQAQVAPQFQTAPRSLITQKIDRSRMVPTLGALNPVVSRYTDTGEVDGTLPIRHIQLLLRRPAERQAAFDAQVEALHTRGNASFHKWLTPAVVGHEFGPSESDLATVTGYLQSEGFTVNYVGTSGLYIDFTGTAAQVEHTFQTKLHIFQVPDVDGVRYAAVQQASLPEALTPAVVGLVALSNVMSGQTNYKNVVPPAQQASLPVGVRADGATPEDTVSSTNYAVSPQDFYTIYNENPLLTAGTNGTGVTIAVLEESAINTADVTTFRTTYGVSPNTPVSLVVDTGYGANTCTAPAKISGEESEAVLDTEWASSIAPSANIIFMQCAGEAVPLGVFYSAEAVIDNNLADTMSLSYGTYETYSSGTEDSLSQALWEQAASQGETVVVSAGDSGAATEDGNAGDTFAKYGITVNGFSSTAWNVSAGGTDFMDTFNGLINSSSNYQIANYWNTTVGTISSALSYIPEMPWNNSCGSTIYSYYYYNGVTEPAAYFCGKHAITNNIVAGGGGPSIVNARPSWQTTVYGLPSTSTYTGRLQPDVSLFASNGLWHHDLPYYESDAGGIGYAGGTSFVAPQLAGVFALLNQYTGERQGQPDYILYNIAAAEYGSGTTPTSNNCNGSGATSAVPTSSSPGTSCIFYDIQAGSNTVPCRSGDADCYALTGDTYGILSTNSTSSSSPAFNTGAGWDMATGIGSININNLFANWQNSTNQYTPTVVLTDTTATTVAYGNTESLIATVSGSGSYPTGSVVFTYTGPTSGTVGTAAIVGGSGCSTASTCTEAATQSIYPAATPSASPYVFTAKYTPPNTNENYVSATSGTVSITVTRQTPTFAVQNVAIITGTATATLTATVTYASSAGSVAPTGTTPFTVAGGSGGTVTGTCAPTSSTVVTCTATYPTSTLGAGNYTISATYSGDSNYTAIATPATGTLTVGAGTAPTISFSVASPQYTMYPTVALTYTSNSTGTVTYSITGTTGTAAGTISGSNLILTPGGSGTITVMLSQAQGGLHFAGSSSSTFTVYAGSVWAADNSTSDLSTLNRANGAVITPSPGLTGAGVGAPTFPLGVAFDSSGDAWIASSTGISEFKPSASGPAAASSTPYSVGGVTSPVAVAVDGLGVIWVANNNGTISALTNTGAAISPSTGYTASGVASDFTNFGGIAIDLSGSVWVTNSADGSVTQVLGVAAPVAPLSTSLANGTTGARP